MQEFNKMPVVTTSFFFFFSTELKHSVGNANTSGNSKQNIPPSNSRMGLFCKYAVLRCPDSYQDFLKPDPDINCKDYKERSHAVVQ